MTSLHLNKDGYGKGGHFSFSITEKACSFFNTREYVDKKDVTSMCRFSWTRLLSSWRNTLYSLIFAFPSFPVLSLVSAKGCVPLKTKSRYKLLCHKTLIFWKPGQDLFQIAICPCEVGI